MNSMKDSHQCIFRLFMPYRSMESQFGIDFFFFFLFWFLLLHKVFPISTCFSAIKVLFTCAYWLFDSSARRVQSKKKPKDEMKVSFENTEEGNEIKVLNEFLLFLFLFFVSFFIHNASSCSLNWMFTFSLRRILFGTFFSLSFRYKRFGWEREMLFFLGSHFT